MSILFSQMKNEQDGSRSKEGSYLFLLIGWLVSHVLCIKVILEGTNVFKYTCSQRRSIDQNWWWICINAISIIFMWVVIKHTRNTHTYPPYTNIFSSLTMNPISTILVWEEQKSCEVIIECDEIQTIFHGALWRSETKIFNQIHCKAT